MRAFIAVVPPAPAIEALRGVCSEIRAIAPALRTEPAEKLHFTLEFLGEKDPSWLETFRGALAEAVPGPFPVTIRRIGFFPGTVQPRIIWAGSRPDENPGLCGCAASVRGACMRLGHAADPKEFHPHITLSRVKSHLPSGRVERIASIAFEPVTFTCTELRVIESILSRHGSEYRTLYTIPLNVSAPSC